jgi:hypothetical protein
MQAGFGTGASQQAATLDGSGSPPAGPWIGSDRESTFGSGGAQAGTSNWSATGSGVTSGSNGAASGGAASTTGTSTVTQGQGEPGTAGREPWASWIGGSFDSGLATLGLQGPGHLPTLPAFLVSTIGVAVWMSFMLFNKRRRDEEPTASDDVLRAVAATGLAVAPGAGFVPPIDPESLMPRWRRPSLMEARRTDPIRSPAPERPRMSFALGLVETISSVERRLVRYAVTPLLDGPDELRASRIGELAAGDEIQVESRSGAYCEVLLPDGRRGWVHRTTLGQPLHDDGQGRDVDDESPAEADNGLAALLVARGLFSDPR